MEQAMEADVASAAVDVPANSKQRIMDAAQFDLICNFICNFDGLPIDCEIRMTNDEFKHIHPETLRSVLQTEMQVKSRQLARTLETKAKEYATFFAEDTTDSTLITQWAKEDGFNPVALARQLLIVLCGNDKRQVAYYLRFPTLLQNPGLSINVEQAVASDNQDGPLMDLKRRLMGEEYEFKLVQKAKEYKMEFYDEKDLRRLGYDKTPDIKLLIPIAYKGNVVNWIESKASFGDPISHANHVEGQLSSYTNRFGPGIIIYWFGYHESLKIMEKDYIVLADFPAKEDLEFIDTNMQEDFQFDFLDEPFLN